MVNPFSINADGTRIAFGSSDDQTPGSPGNADGNLEIFLWTQARCSYSLSATSQSFPASGGSGSVGVVAPIGCAWIASSSASWLTITSGGSGSGNGTITFSVTANTSTNLRQATITVQGQLHTVTQEGTSPLALVGCVACLPGDHFMMRLGAWNPEGSAPVDFYAGALLPDGVTLVFVTSLSPLTLAVGNLSDPRTFQPLLANVSVPEGFEQVFDNVVSHTFSGGEPQGGYIAFGALTRPGAFSDGSNDPGDILAIDLQPFSLGP